MVRKYKYHFFALLSGISWSTLSIFTAYLSRYQIDPFNQVFWRIATACIVTLLISVLFFRKHLRISVKAFWYLLVNALLIMLGYTTFSSSIYLGTPIAKAIALNYSYPLAVVILAYLFFRHIPSKKNIVAIIISLISVMLLTELWKVGELSQIHPGDFLAWLNSIVFAGIIVWGTKIKKEMNFSPFITLFYSWLFAVPFLLVFGIFMNVIHISLFNPFTFSYHFHIIVWSLLFGIGIVGSVIPYSLLYYASAKLKPIVSSILLLSEPALVYLAGIVLFNQQLSVYGIIGMIGIMISALLV